MTVGLFPMRPPIATLFTKFTFFFNGGRKKMPDSRYDSHKIGVGYATRNLKARGYSVKESSSLSMPDLLVTSPHRVEFWVACRNVDVRSNTFIIGKLDVDRRPYFVLSYGAAKGEDPAEFWILTFDEVRGFVGKYKGIDPQGTYKDFEQFYERWGKLPR